ncbi:CrcB family protein [Parvularcula mediterranea]|uniref:CrcB family protein n=1 Tax=Parvularcula mediterranea TaxID=2732508 RepID=UPI00156414A6
MSNFPQTILAVAAGGALGASLRYGFVTFGLGGAWGILALNVAGSFLLGLVVASGEGRSDVLTAFLGAGLLGGLTTYSTYSYDIIRLGSVSVPQAALYVGLSLILGILAFIASTMLVRAAS